MPAEQVLAPAAPPDPELAALQPVEVPRDWWPDHAAGPGLPPCAPPHVPARRTPPRPRQCQPSPHQFALLIVETLAGVRPVRQLAPLLSKRASIHLHRLLPLFSASRRPRVLRVLTSTPAAGVVEMTLIVETGPAHAGARRPPGTCRTAATARRDAPATRWLCTAIEAA